MGAGVEFSGLITNGHLPPVVAADFAALLRKLEGKHVVIAVREFKRRRSNNQNAYYWGVVVRRITEMFRDAGNSVDDGDVHDYLKDHVGKLKQVFVTKDGEVLTGAGSTAKLNTHEMEIYLEKVRAFGAEHGVVIPLPNEGVA